jgi:hypothetical protein
MRRFGFRPGAYGWPAAKQEPEDERSGCHRWRGALLIGIRLMSRSPDLRFPPEPGSPAR